MRIADISKDNLQLGALAARVYIPAGVVGILGLGAAVILAVVLPDGESRFFPAYLTAFAYFLSLALGALFFVLLQHLTGAGWSVVVRRLAEGVAGSLPVLAVLVVPVLLGIHELYDWSHSSTVAADQLLKWKQPYLNTGFFIARCVFYFVVWSLLSAYFIRQSLKQDRTGEWRVTLRMSRRSAPAMVVFALTVTFAAFDLLMSRDPHWYSTIYGVYYFSGAVVGFFALLPFLAVLLQRAGRMQHAITREHYQDMGKLVFAFIVFWAYIAFSQYMLIWYANIPEEASWFFKRQVGPWAGVSLFLVFGHFVVPFFLLLTRRAKRRRIFLAAAALWVLLVHYVDLYWLIMPDAGGSGLGLSVLHAACFAGIGGMFVAAVAFRLRNAPLIPIKDPRLNESLAFENV
jgi:hypothetical protein